MTIFQLDKQYAVVCNWKKTRNGFKHTATLIRNGSEISETKVCYLNRTWETYEYESVIAKLLDKHFTGEQKEQYLAAAKARGLGKVEEAFKSVKALVALAEVFGATTKERNILKKRALAAVPGIEFPEDFDQLPEDEQAQRLDGAAQVLANPDTQKTA